MRRAVLTASATSHFVPRVPYHWGRFRGLADMLGRPPLTFARWVGDHREALDPAA